jgi:hypothetical protein
VPAAVPIGARLAVEHGVKDDGGRQPPSYPTSTEFTRYGSSPVSSGDTMITWTTHAAGRVALM